MHKVLVLRFRDLVDPTAGHTVDAHNQMVEAHGHTWWAWWKKQNEKVPTQLWAELLSQGECEIRLLDSGNRTLYRSLLLDIQYLPGLGQMPAPEDGRATPDYYRKSNFHTWFKLAKIEALPDGSLNELVWLDAPHDDVVIDGEQLLERRMASTRELLQFGNVTYWIARDAAAGDLPADELILPQRRAPAIAPRDVRVLESNVVLHISDIHASTNFHAFPITDFDAANPGLATAISTALQAAKLNPSLVVVTGDLTWTGDAEEFKLAERVLEDLRAQLGLQRDEFILIPGNHDIQWSGSSELYDAAAPVKVAGGTARRHYEEFFRRWYKVPPSTSLAMGRRYLLKNGPSLDLLALNSSQLEQTPQHFAGLGRVTSSSFKAAAGEFGWRDGRVTELRILAVHHHLLPVVHVERSGDAVRGFGLALDAAEQMNTAGEFGVDIVLHGHQHQPFRATIIDDAGRALNVIGAGSCGVRNGHLGPIQQRSFNVLTLSPHEVLLDVFGQAQSPHQFELGSRWRARYGQAWHQESGTPPRGQSE